MSQNSPRRAWRAGASIAIVACFASADGAAGQTPAADSGRIAAAGAFSADQATKGETTFRSICGNCHSITQFNGPAFRKVWTGRTVYELFDQLRNTMPMDNPGGLARDDYAAVIAYLLRINEFPPGTTPLPSTDEGLKRIRF